MTPSAINGPLSVLFSESYLTPINVSQNYKERLISSGISLPMALSQACLKRQCEFLAGRYCAHQALEKLKKATTEIPIGRYREPIWPNNVVGSISHCRNQAVAICATRSQYQSIGIDLEEQLTEKIASKIGEQIVNRDESQFEHHFRGYAELITCIFSAKEAIFKALFPLIKKPMNFSYINLQKVNGNYMTFSLAKPYTQDFSFSVATVKNCQFDQKVMSVCTIQKQ